MVQGAGFRVQVALCRVQGSGCKVQGAGCRGFIEEAVMNPAGNFRTPKGITDRVVRWRPDIVQVGPRVPVQRV